MDAHLLKGANLAMNVQSFVHLYPSFLQLYVRFCFYGKGIRPETAVNAMQITLTTRKNFQATFHHWPSGILQTPRPATSIALVGEMRDMAALPMERPVTAASGFKPISSTSGPKNWNRKSSDTRRARNEDRQKVIHDIEDARKDNGWNSSESRGERIENRIDDEAVIGDYEDSAGKSNNDGREREICNPLP